MPFIPPKVIAVGLQVKLQDILILNKHTNEKINFFVG
jgi:hypothetical protein